ncbi:hypothetical protein DDB_G0267820 [Dictyostelium discoideum AX4]|uniref:Restriction endonuclease type IV Mrr domain-containing protein n=1 Tax=Dictyostelium discoideum TaxID=44689 RepID=Q55G50_DICDI|nr:hypothetical protein DDB_G0267820 [Dictyostelium discoideum AX4]EAL73363.1 hypothetical protein DDB_G0267820 [Dictyostelium discoideum AX4]|eukprot:XP_647333.1 hypothetical protein DDB_G0267820 [Dictyostelium discoideum AX4]
MFRITKFNKYYNKFRSFKRKNIISITTDNFNENDQLKIDKSKNEGNHLKVTLQKIKDDQCWRTKNWFDLKFDEEIDKKEILKNNKKDLELLKEIQQDLNNEEVEEKIVNIENKKEEEQQEEEEEEEEEGEEKPKIKLLRVKKIEINIEKQKNDKNVKKDDVNNDFTNQDDDRGDEGDNEDFSNDITEIENEIVSSTYSKGKIYELKTIEILNEFGMEIIRSGGRDDKGIDFKGNWNLPSNKILKIIGQCKNYSGKKVGPSVIREFESTFLRYQSELDKENSKLLKQDKKSTLGIIVSKSGFSPSIRSFSEEIQYPIVLCHLLDEGILSFYLNFNAKQLLPNIRVARRKNLKTGQFTLDLAYDLIN